MAIFNLQEKRISIAVKIDAEHVKVHCEKSVVLPEKLEELTTVHRKDYTCPTATIVNAIKLKVTAQMN